MKHILLLALFYEGRNSGRSNLTSVTQMFEGKTQIFYSKSSFHYTLFLYPRLQELTQIIIIEGKKNKGLNTHR